VSALRESALAAAGVRGIFTNLIDGKSVGARNTLDVLDPATGELLAKVSDIERDGMDAAFGAARRAFSSWSKLTWEARRSILEKAFETDHGSLGARFNEEGLGRNLKCGNKKAAPEGGLLG
jgi:delta 1-pyrroline-5-carboxylate dehydrogenase